MDPGNSWKTSDSTMAMASKNVSGKITKFKGQGPQPFKMSGQMYHLTPSAVFPDPNNKPKFSQIFVFDQDHEIKNCLHQPKGEDPIKEPTLTLMQNELKTVNPLVRFFKTGAELFNAASLLMFRIHTVIFWMSFHFSTILPFLYFYVATNPVYYTMTINHVI